MLKFVCQLRVTRQEMAVHAYQKLSNKVGRRSLFLKEKLLILLPCYNLNQLLFNCVEVELRCSSFVKHIKPCPTGGSFLAPPDFLDD